MTNFLANTSRDLDGLTHRLQRHSPVHRLNLDGQRLHALHARMVQTVKALLLAREDRFTRVAGVLHAVSPLATLARGYAIIRKMGKEKSVITNKTQVQPGETVEVILHQGNLRCRVEGEK
jgi:exodeoxyribonuclease VII large subunit